MILSIENIQLENDQKENGKIHHKKLKSWVNLKLYLQMQKKQKSLKTLEENLDKEFQRKSPKMMRMTQMKSASQTDLQRARKAVKKTQGGR